MNSSALLSVSRLAVRNAALCLCLTTSVACVSGAQAAVRPAPPADLRHTSGEVMVDATYDVSDGDLLLVDVPDADVVLRTGPTGSAHVLITVDGRDAERARRYYEEQKITVDQSSRAVRIVSERTKRRFSISWSTTDRARILIEVTLPERFDLDVSTSDGDIRAGRHVGTHAVRTSDGNIEFESLSGSSINVRTSDGDIRFGQLDSEDIHVRTSDGDVSVRRLNGAASELVTSDGSIRVDEVLGRASFRTSDGNIVVGRADNSTISTRTSDGNIKIGSLRSGGADARTSDGSIQVEVLAGTLDASTSDGDVYVGLTGRSQVSVRVGDGDVVIAAPGDLEADIQLSGERVRLATDFPFRGRVQRTSAEGSINGGGELIRAKASGGTVFLRTDSGRD